MRLFTDFILVTGLIVIVIMLFSMFKAREKALPQKVLIVFFIFLFFCILNGYAELHELSFLYPFTFIPIDSGGLFAGPLLYVYVKSLYQEPQGLIKRNIWHFIPWAIFLIFLTIPYLYSNSINEIVYVQNIYKEYYYLIFIPQDIILIIYIILSIRLLNMHTNLLKLNYSSLVNINLNWVKVFLWGLLIIIAVNVTTSVYETAIGNLNWRIQYLTYYLAVVLVVYLAYYGVSQSRIFLPDFIVKNDISTSAETTDIENSIKSHHLSNATEGEIEILISRLKEVLENDKPYLDEELTLGKLAQLIPTTDKKLSALLNHKMQITFYDLINSYRVEEVKSKMSKEKYSNYTLLAIAYDSGFKSKTSFNRIFKKATGFSPSEFKKKHLNYSSNKPLTQS